MKNQNIAFMLKKKELTSVSTESDRIKILEELVQLNPQGERDLTERSKFKEELVRLKRKGSSKKGVISDNPYDGLNYDIQIVLVGEPNSGKSTLLHRLTGVNVQISENPYTTYKPEVGIFVYHDIPMQVVEAPSIYKGDNDPRKYQFIRNSDVVCITSRSAEEAESVQATLEDHLIIPSRDILDSKGHKYRPKDEIIEKPTLVASWESFQSTGLNVVDINSNEGFGSEVYRLLNIKRVYCSRNGKIEGTPLTFPMDLEVTVQDFARRLGMTKVKGAKLYGPHSQFDGQTVGLSYVLNDGDMVWLR